MTNKKTYIDRATIINDIFSENTGVLKIKIINFRCYVT